ncbi:MAG TPA: TraB/GumN family protein [Methylomirabilota bacterium]|nr:TraB/GumN family protein [Methylomirabilota bacterium]
MRVHRWLSILFFSFFTLSARANAQQFFRWEEAVGAVHYSQPPALRAADQPRNEIPGDEKATPDLQNASPPLSSSFSHGLLWKIEAPAALHPPPPPSYLFGTIHSGDQRVMQLPAAVQHALIASQSFCMELLPDLATTVTLTKSMLYADGHTLQDTVGQELFAQLVSLMQQRGVPALALTKFKPWAVYMTLSMPQAQTGQFLDLLLYEQAQQHGKTVCGIETAAEQVAVFEHTPLADQLSLLREIVNHPHATDLLLQKMIPLYLQRDIGGLYALSTDAADATAEERQSLEAFLKRLIDERNQRIAERLLARFARESTFAAVGALHLPGPTGVLQLLANRGCTVVRVF